MDDIFTVFDTNECNAKQFVNFLKNKFTSIKFTYKLEHNGYIPVLNNNLDLNEFKNDDRLRGSEVTGTWRRCKIQF